jgi:hypothetical protein
LLHRTVKPRLITALSASALAIAALAATGGLSASAIAAPAASASTFAPARLVHANPTSKSNLVVPAKKHHHKKKHHRHHKPLKDMAPKQIAWHIMGWFKWTAKYQFRYLNKLWMRESSWNKYATNPWSGAYGIPQAVPGNKMSSVGSDWRTNAETQIRWGMRYIKSVYGSPQRAWDHEVNDGWY